MKVEQFFKEWISTRPNLKTEFHEAGIEAMAFADAYYKKKLSISGVMQAQPEKVCPKCGSKKVIMFDSDLDFCKEAQVCEVRSLTHRLCRGWIVHTHTFQQIYLTQ